MKSNKGFTLIELLTVVVILGIIVIIATNIVLTQVRKSEKQAFLTDIQQFIKSTDYDSLVKDKMDDYVVYQFPNSGIEILPKDADAGYMIKDENSKVKIQAWNNTLSMCASKSFNDKSVDLDESIKSADDCKAFLPNITSDKNVSVKDLTGDDVDYTLKASCYTLDSEGYITNFDTTECGTVLVVPNKINGIEVKGFSDSFVADAPKDFTSLYLIGVKNITSLPANLLSGNLNFKKSVISLLPNLEQINYGFLNGNPSLEAFYLTNCPKLTTIGTQIASYDFRGIVDNMAIDSSKLENITLENLPKLEKIDSSFRRIQAEKINISNLESLTQIAYGSFEYNTGDSVVTISNNPNLVTITNGAFDYSNINKMKIYNNAKLEKITDGSIVCAASAKNYIDELYIYNNPNLEKINNQAFMYCNMNNVKIYNNPKLTTINYNAFGSSNIEKVDLSDVPLTTLDISGFYHASVDEMIIPSTITTITNGTASAFNDVIKDRLEISGSNKCNVVSLFRTLNGDGTYTYLIDKNKLPECQ